MDVKDFLTTYPNFDSSFENNIFHLKEFNKERLTYETTTTEDRWRTSKSNG